MQDRIQIVTVLLGVALVFLVVEMVRRRRLSERYALIWIFSAIVILGVAVWQGLLERISSALGIAYPPTAIFLVAFVFLILLLLNVSAAISRLQDHTRVLAQRLAILESRVDEAVDDAASQHLVEATDTADTTDPPAAIR